MKTPPLNAAIVAAVNLMNPSWLAQLRPRPHPRRRDGANAILCVALLLACAPMRGQSAAPPAGTSIGNQASATYTDASNTERTATSNVAITIVQQVASFVLTTEGQTRYAAPGGQVYFPHTLRNTGNGTDTFDLSVENAADGDDFNLNAPALYADANGDGIPDNSAGITSSGPLAAGATFQLVAVGIVPGGQSSDETGILRVLANGTATATPATTQTNSDTATVTANAVVNVTKAISANSGAAGSGPHTVTLTYNNVGNNTATNVTLLDPLPAAMVYVTNSARWSVTGSGTALTDGEGDSQGTAPDTVTYDYNETAAGRVTAVITRVQPGQSGTITFQVTIAAGQSAGVIENTVSYRYDPGTGTPVGPYPGNTTRFTVAQTSGVTITGQTVANAAQGSTVIFTNLVMNTGNASDAFDVTITNLSFPSGTTFTLYQSDANTPLVDTSGNGRPDTGPLTTNQVYAVIVKAVLPNGSAGTGVNYTASVTATSTASAEATATGNDVLNDVTSNTVDLTHGAEGGAGPGPEASPVRVSAVNPGTTTRFTLWVTNTSGVADTFNLSASTTADFSTVNLPADWSVTFRDTSEAIITSSGVLVAGAAKAVYADVTVPAGYAPGTNSIYFRVLSPTSGVSDRLHDAVAVNTVRSLTLAPNNNGQVFPGGAVVYSHLVVNAGNVLEGDNAVSTATVATTESLSGWSSVVYYDANTNGMVDAGDPVITDLSMASGGGAGLAAGETARLLVQVFAPPGTPLGAINASTLTLSTANGTQTATAPATVVATDTSTVISGDLQLLKEQALDANLDGLPDTAYGSGDITTGAIPGRGIRYRITVTNRGIAPATAVKVHDTTPTYTVYTETVAAATTRGSVALKPADGASGPLEFDIGTLNPGESAVVTFGVLIAQ